MSQVKKTYQLQMVMSDADLQIPPLPDGYSLRTFHKDDTAKYLEVMQMAGFPFWNQEFLDGILLKVLPDGLFVVEHESGDLAATALCTHGNLPLHPYGGELGWVAGHVHHAGKGLGKIVCAAVVDRFRRGGYTRIYLHTDDFRMPAIKSYLQLGFLPFLFDDDMHDRWQKVCEQLKWPFEPEKWPTAQIHETHEPPTGERPNQDDPNSYKRRKKWLPGRHHKAYPGGGDMDAFGDESLYMPSLLGFATAEPSTVSAGETSPLVLEFTAGPAGVNQGETVTFNMRGQNPLGKLPDEFTLEAPDSCVLLPSGVGFKVVEGVLTEGQTVKLVYEPFKWTPLAGRREFKITITPEGNSPELRLPEPVVMTTLPGSSEKLEALLPPTHNAEDQSRVLVTLRDSFDNRTPIETDVRVSIGQDSKVVRVVDGRAEFEYRLNASEACRLEAQTVDGNLKGLSNPSIPTDEYQLFIGDLHTHDFLSQSEGYTDQVYHWARDEKRLDFLSVVPQSHGWHDNETWTVTKYMNERYLDEGRFVTFLGFEWQHTGYGDKVVHFLGGDQPYLPADDPRYTSPEKLYHALSDCDAFIISHHTAYPENCWMPATDFDAVDPYLERVVEIWSMHGSSEGYDNSDRPLWKHDPNHTAMAALRKGLRLGFVAGSDTHSARPGGSVKEPLGHYGGLAAVWAKDLTRRSLYEAIRARRTYALMQSRIILKMMVNDTWMGSEIEAADTVKINIQVHGTAPIAKVEIVKNTQLLKEFGPFSEVCEIDFEDKTNGAAFYHCRVTQVDGQLAVCSPVWVG